MDAAVPTIALPGIPHFYNVVVFPSPLKDNNESRIFLLKNSDVVPACSFEPWLIEHIPGSFYCLMPSQESKQGKVSLYTSRPGFLDAFSYCLEVDQTAIGFPRADNQNAKNPEIVAFEKETDESEVCSGCFSSHFPRPNMRSCKFARKRKEKACSKQMIWRLRGGAGGNDEILDRAILNAKIHGISIHGGVRNRADGNCAFESVIDSINTRKSFNESLDGTPEEYRYNWMSKVEKVAYEKWNNGLSREEWRSGWEIMKLPGIYEHSLGDLVLPGIAHCTKKDILIFNTSLKAHSPIYVVEASKLCGQKANTEIPICLAYNQVHFEALTPDSKEDELKTIDLKKAFTNGSYGKKMDDIPFFKADRLKQKNSYAAAVKRNLDDENSKKLNPLHNIQKERKTEAQQNELLDVKKDKRLEESNEECSLSLESLRLIKIKDRTKSQTRRYKKLMADLSRARKSEEEKDIQKRKDRDAKRKVKAGMTEQDKEIITEKNREAKKKSRSNMTKEKKVKFNEYQKKAMRKLRSEITE